MKTPEQYFVTWKKRARWQTNEEFTKFLATMQPDSVHFDWVMMLVSDYANYMHTMIERGK